MELLDGKVVAASIKTKLSQQVRSQIEKGKDVPHLVAILVGNDGASETYVAAKVKTCKEIGYKSTLVKLNADVPENELLSTIQKFNDDTEVHGILVQLPLPKHISESKVISLIDPLKDVDGFNPVNMGKVVQGTGGFVPATPHGIQLMLAHYGIETKGKHAVVIGRSNIVGRPMSILLSLNEPTGNCTVTICHSHTKNLAEICASADIIVAALGRPGFLKKEMVKAGAVVIDVGITRIPDAHKKSGYALKGDVDFENVSPLCSYISPVPGGVGVMTIAALMSNTYKAYQQFALNKREDLLEIIGN